MKSIFKKLTLIEKVVLGIIIAVISIIAIFVFVDADFSAEKKVVRVALPTTTTTSNSALEERIDDLEDRLNEVVVESSLAELDAYLDALESGGDYRGSFTDVFMPTAYRAFEAGAWKGSIEARFDRLVELTRQGLYLSSYHTALVERDGIEGFETYLQESFDLWEERLASDKG